MPAAHRALPAKPAEHDRPEECPLVYLVMSDDELWAGLHKLLQHRRLAAA
ncbi:DUF6767 domain-containing protein [Dactylosporangium sp. NPDC051541]